MFTYVLFTIALMLFVLAVVMLVCSVSDTDMIGPGVFMIVMTFVPLTPVLGLYSHATNDIFFMSQINNRIEMVETEFGKLDAQIKAAETVYKTATPDITPTGSINVTANADSPISTLLQTRMIVVEKLISYKDKRFKKLAEITANCLGPMSATRTLFFDGYCEQQ